MNFKIKEIWKSDFLTNKSTYLTWVWSSFNIAWNYYECNESSSGAEADLKAMASDFYMVGQDLNSAFSMQNKLNA